LFRDDNDFIDAIAILHFLKLALGMKTNIETNDVITKWKISELCEFTYRKNGAESKAKIL